MKHEKLGQGASVKTTILGAHLDWLRLGWGAEAVSRLALGDGARQLAQSTLLATDWMPFTQLIEIDKAIAAFVGGNEERAYREMGRHSAAINLRGVYKSFVRDEPHRFFQQYALLHRRFQDFGTARYEITGIQSGRLIVEEFTEYSPVFCVSGLGYYLGAVEMMGPGAPVEGEESLCQCSGDPACLFDICW